MHRIAAVKILQYLARDFPNVSVALGLLTSLLSNPKYVTTARLATVTFAFATRSEDMTLTLIQGNCLVNVYRFGDDHVRPSDTF